VAREVGGGRVLSCMVIRFRPLLQGLPHLGPTSAPSPTLFPHPSSPKPPPASLCSAEAGRNSSSSRVASGH
jgi:hypothetical protein